MSEFRIELLFLICFVGVLIIYGTIRNSVKKRRTIKQKQTSSIHCHHCGSPMLESDVFCENCWKITPKVQKMLDHNSDKKPDFYHALDNGYKLRCPHCKNFYCQSRTHSSITLDPPIIYCPKCKQYFIDTIYFEWSVASLLVKFEDFYIIPLWNYLFFIPILISCIVNRDWFILQDIGFLFLVYSVLRLIWNKTVKRKRIHKSYMRLEQNPEYPQILIDMGYWKMMSKEYHHLSKEPIIPPKDKLKNFIKFIKDAFTFD